MKLIVRLIAESFAFAWQALVVNKLRTFLSLLGVSIGIFSIIFVLSVVDSMEADMKTSLDMIGSDILFVQKWPMGPEDGAKEYEWWKYMSRRQPSLRDMENLNNRLPAGAVVAFEAGTNVTAEYKNNYLEDVGLVGVSHKYNETISINIASGRYFSHIESESGKNLAIIGNTVAQQLFGNGDPLGKEIKVGGVKALVIGVLKKEGASLFGSGFDAAVVMPIEFATRLIDVRNEDSKIIIKAPEGTSNAEMKSEVTSLFREIRGISPRRSNDFSIIESSMISGIVDSIIGVFNVAGMIIGVFAILVGAFSIANIMFVSVKERTNIIGIQKSLGAKNYFILFQFLFESIALCLIGGAFGLLLVKLLTAILSGAMDFEFILPVSRIFMGLGIAVGVGVVSGIIPALNAAKLSPVDAMRSK
jgi:putative ABC transport system permease protein